MSVNATPMIVAPRGIVNDHIRRCRDVGSLQNLGKDLPNEGSNRTEDSSAICASEQVDSNRDLDLTYHGLSLCINTVPDSRSCVD